MPPGLAYRNGIACCGGAAAGYFCEESGTGSQRREDQWGFHPTGRVASMDTEQPADDLGSRPL
jgi:hypothetical protein